MDDHLPGMKPPLYELRTHLCHVEGIGWDLVILWKHEGQEGWMKRSYECVPSEAGQILEDHIAVIEDGY